MLALWPLGVPNAALSRPANRVAAVLAALGSVSVEVKGMTNSLTRGAKGGRHVNMQPHPWSPVPEPRYAPNVASSRDLVNVVVVVAMDLGFETAEPVAMTSSATRGTKASGCANRECSPRELAADSQTMLTRETPKRPP